MRKVPIEHIQPGMITKKPVLGFLGQVLLGQDVEIKERHIYYLKQMGINAVYIHDSQMGDIDLDDLISFEVRSESRALVAQVMKDLDTAGPSKKGIAINDREILEAVSKIVDQLLENKDVLVQLSDIRALDGYLFAHCVNCCVLATLIAARMNYEPKILKILATGALLHDIGLIAVPRMILNKPGALSEEEYEAVKRHPLYGHEIFKKSKLFSERSGDIILQHHERSEGQGYPQGLRGKEISSLARIVLVADVYDALTSDKAYRPAYPVHEAVEMMLSWGGELFDIEVLNTFLDQVTAYPVGSLVQVNNGESGLVVANSPGYTLRPVVRMLYKRDLTPHPAPYDLDLRKTLDMIITGLVEPSELPGK